MGNDFSTPALYFFSTVAQTMGAIIAIVLTGVFAIIPQIQQRNNNPGSEVLIRLLKRDNNFLIAIRYGFLTILTSIVGLLLLYVTGLSQVIAIDLLIIFVIACILFGILTINHILIFLLHNIQKYNSIENCYINLVEKQNNFSDIDINIDYLIVSTYYYSVNYEKVYNLINAINRNLDSLYNKYNQKDIYELYVAKLRQDVFSKAFNYQIFKIVIVIFIYLDKQISNTLCYKLMTSISDKINFNDNLLINSIFEETLEMKLHHDYREQLWEIDRFQIISNNFSMLYYYYSLLLSYNWENFDSDFDDLKLYQKITTSIANNEISTQPILSLIFIILLALLKYTNLFDLNDDNDYSIKEYCYKESLKKAYDCFVKIQENRSIDANDISLSYNQIVSDHKDNNILIMKLIEVITALCFNKNINLPDSIKKDLFKQSTTIRKMQEMYSIDRENILNIIVQLDNREISVIKTEFFTYMEQNK